MVVPCAGAPKYPLQLKMHKEVEKLLKDNVVVADANTNALVYADNLQGKAQKSARVVHGKKNKVR